MDELKLVEGLVERRESDVDAFLQRYRPLFFHCIAHFESGESAREDLFQDLILYVFERLDRDRFDASKGSFGTWLYRVAWCRCVDLKRKEGAASRPRLQGEEEAMPERIDESPSPGSLAETSEIGGVVRQAMQGLGREERRLLDLRHMQGATLIEIAAELEISLEQVKYRLKRATTSLRRVLLRDFAFEEATE